MYLIGQLIYQTKYFLTGDWSKLFSKQILPIRCLRKVSGFSHWFMKTMKVLYPNRPQHFTWKQFFYPESLFYLLNQIFLMETACILFCFKVSYTMEKRLKIHLNITNSTVFVQYPFGSNPYFSKETRKLDKTYAWFLNLSNKCIVRFYIL